MNKLAKIIGVILISGVTAFGMIQFFGPDGSATEQKETVFERVLRTGTIRCGYWNWDPLVSVDPNNPDDISGIFVDYMKALGDVLELEVKWTQEIGFAELEPSLQADKFDVMCGGVWPTASRSKVIGFARPIFYVPMYAYTKKNVTKYDGNLSALNDPDIRFSTMDGLVSVHVIDTRFSKAEKLQLPDTASLPEVVKNVTSGKADVTIQDLFTAQNYFRNHPETLRRVESDEPITYFPNVLAVRKDEDNLKEMLSVATNELLRNGQIEPIIRKFEEIPGSLLRVRAPYSKPDPDSN